MSLSDTEQPDKKEDGIVEDSQNSSFSELNVGNNNTSEDDGLAFNGETDSEEKSLQVSDNATVNNSSGLASASDKNSKDEEINLSDVNTGIIYSSHGEISLNSLERAKSTNWTDEDERAYLERIKSKAIMMAQQIVEKARSEADQIRQMAHDEGYNKGMDLANEELEEFRSTMADSVHAVLSTIEGQCSHLFTQCREDLLEVCKLSVEKMTGFIIDGSRNEILTKLVEDSITKLGESRQLTISCNPTDEPAVGDIIAAAKEKYPDVQAWRVKAEESISAGGLLIENESSLAESLVESRRNIVEQVLEHLTLPEMI